MSKKTKNPKLVTLTQLSLLCIAMMALALVGVVYCMINNEVVSLQRDNETICREINTTEADIKMLNLRIAHQIDPYRLKQRLAGNSSRMVPIELGRVENIEPSRLPVSSAVAENSVALTNNEH